MIISLSIYSYDLYALVFTVKTAFYNIRGQRPPAFYDRNFMHR